MREELKTEIANEKRSCEERGERMEEEMQQHVKQMKEMESKLEEREQQIQTLKQQLQTQLQHLQDQQTQFTATTKILEQQVQTCVKMNDFEQRIETTVTKLSRDFQKEIDTRTAALEKKMEKNNEQQNQVQERQLQDQQSQVKATTKKVRILEQQVQTCAKDFERKIEATDTKLRQDFKKAIDSKAATIERKMERDSEQRARELNQVARVQAQLQRSVESRKNKVEEMGKRVQTLDSTLFPREYYFLTFPYEQLKTKKSFWYSPPMYTHPGGYKYCVSVLPNGDKGTHLSLYLFALPGEFDDQLRWPVKVSCTVELQQEEGEADVPPWNVVSINERRPAYFCPTGGNHCFATQCVVESKHLKYDCLNFKVLIKVI